MSVADLRKHGDAKISSMRIKRYSWWQHWRELADWVLPRRYHWLIIANQLNRGSPLNYNIIDSTATLAARTLASGMFAGVTSPTRPWFKMKIENSEDDMEISAWLTECERRMMKVFQESNFYTSMSVMFFDLVVFGTAVVLIYQDFYNVIHCFTPCCGEYFLDVDHKFQVRSIGREFVMTLDQLNSGFPFKNLTSDVKMAAPGSGNAGALGRQEKIVWHIIEPNVDNFDVVPKIFKFREYYWQWGAPENQFLSVKGFHEWPAMTPRWDVQSNDPYGRSPGMDALGDTKQLQQETRRKGQAIDKMVNPPMLADVSLRNQPQSLLPGGVVYVAGLSTGREGMRPVYQVMPPIGEMKQDIQEIQQRIKITFHNDLFTGISDLETVRTATEIDARREEKLVLLGPTLERIMSVDEGLGAAIDRTFAIMWRGGLLPPPPAKLRGPTHIQVDYISMLAMAQRGLATAAIEKVWGFAGNVAAAKPNILDRLNEDETILEYGRDLGVTPKIFNDDEKVKAMRDERSREQAAATAAQGAQAAVEGAQTLSQTDVGGGANALQLITGGAGAKQ